MQTLYKDAAGKFTSKDKAVKTIVVNKTSAKRAPTKGPIAAQPAVQPVTGITHYALVLDRSSSMAGISKATVDAYNNRLSALKQEAQKNNLHFTVTLVTFASYVDVPKVIRQPLDSVQPLNYSDYYPSGSTALLDAVGQTIEELQKCHVGPNDAILVEVITDGEENNSMRYGGVGGRIGYRSRLIDTPALLQQLQQAGYWTFAFQVPRGAKNALNRDFGIPLENINEWEATDVGTRVATQCTTQSLASYSTARTLGARSTDTFFMKADLSKVTDNQLRGLSDLSSRYKVLDVDKEQSIKEFIERKGKCQYVIGAAFYEVCTKDELIQPTKEVLVMKKGENRIYGGQQARALLGLPSNKNVKLNPFNLSVYRVFVQSTSVNRVLVRGTKVLVDTQKWVHSQPTWGDLSKQV